MELNFESWMTDLERFATWEEEWIKQNQALAEISDRNHNVIEQLLQSGETIQLELGAGSEQCREGWTTVDMFPGCDLQLDLREPLPFPDESISMIYSSHVLEHFAYPQPMKICCQSVTGYSKKWDF
ncbi:MAG: hypothetical protein HC825_10060 [Oscillatoriales cyanobacterium RM1_1_9]|nr:hypothetical protein [Oscillatoriales cyanobacterium RM1_1_9]